MLLELVSRSGEKVVGGVNVVNIIFLLLVCADFLLSSVPFGFSSYEPRGVVLHVVASCVFCFLGFHKFFGIIFPSFCNRFHSAAFLVRLSFSCVSVLVAGRYISFFFALQSRS